MNQQIEKVAIKAWAEDDRPREKLLRQGRSVLSDAELLAILIGSGNTDESAVDLCRRILHDVSGNLQELGKASVTWLVNYKGIGEAKAIAIVAALELGRRRQAMAVIQRPSITSSKDVFNLMHPLLADVPHEEFWVLLLNRANKVIDQVSISKGGISGTVADSRLIFKQAINRLASAVILCHNHPSGNRKASEADRRLTKKLKEAGQLLDIPVLDHVIICDESYYSFADEGCL